MIKQIKDSVPNELSEEYLSPKSIFLAVALWRTFGGEIQIRTEDDLSIKNIEHAWLSLDGCQIDIDGAYPPIVALDESDEDLVLGLDETTALEFVRTLVEISDKEWEKEVKKAIKIVKRCYIEE
jgi:hypothetical protein